MFFHAYTLKILKLLPKLTELCDILGCRAAYTNQSRITVYDNQAEGKLQEYAGEVGASAYFTQLGPRNRESPEVDMRLEHVEDSPQHVVQMAWANTVCGHSGVVETLFLDAAGKVVQQYVFTQETTNLKHGCDPSAAITTLPAVAPASTAEANHACTQTIAFSVLKQVSACACAHCFGRILNMCACHISLAYQEDTRYARAIVYGLGTEKYSD